MGSQISTAVGPDILVHQAVAEVRHDPALHGLPAVGLLLLALHVDVREIIRNGSQLVSKVFLAPSFSTGLDYSFICQLFK